jgi:hypothetical protein
MPKSKARASARHSNAPIHTAKAARRADVESLYWNIPDAAQAVGMKPSSIRRRLWLGQLKRFHCGGRTLVLRSEVLGLVKEGGAGVRSPNLGKGK